VPSGHIFLITPLINRCFSSVVNRHPSVVIQIIHAEDIIPQRNYSSHLKDFCFGLSCRIRTLWAGKSDPRTPLRFENSNPKYFPSNGRNLTGPLSHGLYFSGTPQWKLYEPLFVLAESKAKTFVGGSESLPMHCCYRMSEDGLWLVSAMCDGVGRWSKQQL